MDTYQSTTRLSAWSREDPAPEWLRAKARKRANQLKIARLHDQRANELAQEIGGRVAQAMRDPYSWATEFTLTYNEHWEEEGRQVNEPFPRWPYIEALFALFQQKERILLLEKSRDMMVSWACVAYFTWQAQRLPQRGVVFQTQKDDKVIELIDYAKCLYRHQPLWLQEAFPLAKPIEKQEAHSLEFAHGSRLIGIPGGASQIRSYHPWGYLNDESSFQPEAGDCYDEALSAVKGKIIFNSSAGPGWYADFRKDIIRNEIE